MKNSILSILLFTMITIFNSCNKYLDINSISNQTVENFYKTPGDISQALVGVYNSLLGFPDVNNYNLSEIRSSNYYIASVDAARDYYTLSRFQTNSALVILKTSWANSFRLIARANNILGTIDNVSYDDENLKNQAIGQCKFLRAFAYFELVKNFGGVPLVTGVVTSDDAYNLPRSSADSVYQFIISELSDIVNQNLLPYKYSNSADLGRVTLNAALGMLGKVYLYYAGAPYYKTENYPKALELFKKVLDQENQTWTFCPKYTDLFKYVSNNKYALFEVNFKAGGLGLGSSIPAEIVPVSITYSWFPYGVSIISGNPSQDLFDSFEQGDLRKFATLDTVYRNRGNTLASGRWVKKYLDTTVSSQLTTVRDWPIDFPLLRSEDVMLMYAEVANELNGPEAYSISLVNRIRARAGLANLTNVTSKEAFKISIFKERRSEFAWEGLYWFDLVRTGSAVNTMNNYFKTYYPTATTVIQDYQILLPLPLDEINSYPGLYTQNPGYD